MVWLVGLVFPNFEKRFMEDYANGVGRYLVLPDREFWEHDSAKAVVRHELVHMTDYCKNPIWFTLTYFLLPLPIVFTGRGIHWELRGYCQNLIVEYEETGSIDDETLDWVVSQFSGPMYLFMFPFKKWLRSTLETLRDDIEAGRLRGVYPDVGIKDLLS